MTPKSVRDDLDEMLLRVWDTRRYEIDVVSHTDDEVTVTLRRKRTGAPAGFALDRRTRRPVPRRR